MDFEILNSQPVVNVGIIGHVAHGKSTLVKQITGIKTQKHANEQKSGRTVKLGYANVKIYQCERCDKYYTRGSKSMTSPFCTNMACQVKTESNEENITDKDTTDKEEEKSTCVLRNHVSFADCFDPKTLVMLHNGDAVKVSDITTDDTLMGPDGKPRNIKKIWSGEKVMYEIRYIDKEGNDSHFKCTGGHILVIRKQCNNELRTEKEIEITVEALLSLDKNEQKKYKLFTSPYMDDQLGNEDIPFTITQLDIGPYIGFEIDDDGRFLFPDFVVAHNCPGHEVLMTTMLNGTAVMDCALLVVAANETVPQLQTQEHLIAAESMGLDNILLVQNKVDLVSKEALADNTKAITEWVTGSCAEGSPIVPISAQFGYGVQRVIEALANLKPARRGTDRNPIFACVRSFDINKPGSTYDSLAGGVIGGTLLQGTLSVGDSVEIRPGVKCANPNGENVFVPFVTEVTSIRSENNSLESVIPGGLIAIGTHLDPYFTAKDALIGCIMGKDLPDLQDEITIKYRVLRDSGIKILKPGDSFRITALSRTVMATVLEKIKGQKRTVKVKLNEPLCIVEGHCNFSISVQTNRQWRLAGVATVLFEKEVVFEKKASTPSDIDKTSNVLTKSTQSLVQSNIENERDFGRTLPPYEVMKEEIIDKCDATTKITTLKLDPPQSARQGGARTVWTNFGKNVNQLKKPMEHFRSFVSNELATTTSVSEKGELILFGRFTGANFESIIRSYIKTYCKCNNCGNCATTLMQDTNADVVVCTYCGRNTMVATTKTGLYKKGKGGKIRVI